MDRPELDGLLQVVALTPAAIGLDDPAAEAPVVSGVLPATFHLGIKGLLQGHKLLLQLPFGLRWLLLGAKRGIVRFQSLEADFEAIDQHLLAPPHLFAPVQQRAQSGTVLWLGACVRFARPGGIPQQPRAPGGAPAQRGPERPRGV